MNVYFIIAGVLSLFATIGHLIMGGKSFLAPMLAADFAEIPKKVMHCAFHFITVYFAVSTAAFIFAGFDLDIGMDLSSAAYMATAQYLLLVVVQVGMVLASDIKGGLLKIYQWSIFLLIGVFGLLGILLGS